VLQVWKSAEIVRLTVPPHLRLLTPPTLVARRDALTKWEDLCEAIGEKPADVALAWTLSKSFVTGPIIGPRTIEQLDGSLRALEIEITTELNEKIDAIFPAFKTSPEHYAW
jgi:aryl-alcohol dehydrogenase-like predicted oxidoreductase